MLHRQLELKIDVSPMPVQLSDTRQMKVAVSLFNRSHKYAHLDFPTTQRIEVLLKNAPARWLRNGPRTSRSRTTPVP